MIGRKTGAVEAYWQRARKAKGIADANYHARTFAEPGFSSKVDYISGLAAAGVKRGTCHLALDFEVNQVPQRQAGDHWVVLDSANKPLCVVRVARIDVKPFNAIGEDFSSVENEGDGSFKYWYDGHFAYFKKQCESWGREWRMDLPCVCEYFEVVYKE
ncbi:MAG: ASCH domain-containing protein [Alphaproteobacteria bacterium]